MMMDFISGMIAENGDKKERTMTNIQLIATDLDGTLLNSEHKVSRENEQALKEASWRMEWKLSFQQEERILM